MSDIDLENINEVIRKIAKLHKKIKIYSEKLIKMGLDEEEKVKYYALLEECIRYKFLANDAIFDKNILNDKILPSPLKEKYEELKKTIDWDGKIIFDPYKIQQKKEMWGTFTNYKKRKIKKLMQETFFNLVEFIVSQSIQHKYPNIDQVANILSDGQDISMESILTFLACRFELLEYSFTGGVKIDEKIINSVKEKIEAGKIDMT